MTFISWLFPLILGVKVLHIYIYIYTISTVITIAICMGMENTKKTALHVTSIMLHRIILCL